MSIPQLSLDECYPLYKNQDWTRLAQKFIDVFRYFNEHCYVQFSRAEKVQFDTCISTFFFLFSQPDFQVPAEYARVFINVNHVITNLAMSSSVGSTLPALTRVANQDNNYVKLLTLATCHTPLDVDIDALFEPNPELTSIWWLNYQTAAAGTLSREVHDRVVHQLQRLPKRFILPDFRTAPLYFQCTYFSPDTDHIIKAELNRQIRGKLASAKVTSAPKNTVAIITDRWQPTTAVYKSCYHQIEALSKRYDLTLVHFSEDTGNKIDRGLFKATKRVYLEPDMKRLNFSEIKHNDFKFAYFPDIGMNYESVCLSNMQVAPIMATGYGHPVSTFGSKVDYFIGGLDAEVPDLAERNYSERLVLIPGIGAHPVFPNYTKKNPQPTKFIINCCWTAPKINYPMMSALREIKRRSSKPIHFNFFPSWTVSRYQAAVPFLKNMDTFFKGDVTVYFDTPYQQYLELLEQGRFSLDSHPFGGYNTVVDSLFVGCPVVTIEGTRFFNRASSALMRKVGLSDLVTTLVDDYIGVAVELIDNDHELQVLRDQIASTDLRTLLVDNTEPEYFAEAIDNLIKNHTGYKAENSRKPIILA
jgi:hypothetical protein